jgi:hypothetical protein
MKYIILGKSLKKGTVNDDSSSLSIYFELGWEVVGSRIDIINKINSGEINSESTTLVTTDDRKFMYSYFFDKVISYDEFKKIRKENNIVEDWTESQNFSFLNAYNNFVDLETKKLVNFERDYDLLFNGFDLKNTIYSDISEDFVVLTMRYRDHNGHKNADEFFFKSLISEIKKEICNKIFIVGYGSENFAKNNDCVYVDKLYDYVYLIKHKNCRSLVSQTTGTLCLALMCSNTHIQVLDNTSCSELYGDNAVLGGRCVHLFKNGLTSYYEPLSDNLIPKVINKIKN